MNKKKYDQNYIYIHKVKLETLVEDDPKVPFLILQHRDIGEGATQFPGLLNFTLDPYLIMLSVKQGCVKCLV